MIREYGDFPRQRYAPMRSPGRGRQLAGHRRHDDGRDDERQIDDAELIGFVEGLSGRRRIARPSLRRPAPPPAPPRWKPAFVAGPAAVLAMGARIALAAT